MRKNMRFGRYVILTALLGCLVSGCSADPAATGQEAAVQEQETGITEINWWSFPIFAQTSTRDEPGTYERELIAAFEKENPDIKIRYTRLNYIDGPEQLSISLKRDEECDLLLDAPGRIMDYGKKGYLVKLDDMFDESFLADVDNPELIGACKSQDTAYMYPMSSAPFYMAFNRRMLKSAGVLDLVHEGWTTEDFTKVTAALQEAGYVPGAVFCKGTGGDQGTRAFVANLYDGEVVSPDGSAYLLGSEKGIKAIKYISSEIDQGRMLSGTLLTGTEAVEKFVYGQASFTILWGTSLQKNYKILMDTFGVIPVEVPLPSEDGVPELEYLVNGFCVMDHGNQKKIEAAKRFIRFACDTPLWGPRNVQRSGCIPVRKSFGNIYYGDSHMEKVAGWTKYYAPYYNTVDGFADMRELWSSTLQDILGGYEAPENAMKNFQEKANLTLRK